MQAVQLSDADVSGAIARTAGLYDRVSRFVPPFEWPAYAADVDAILRLKSERNAVILAHNYQTPEIFHGVADHRRRFSLATRARSVPESDADIILARRRPLHGRNGEDA